MRANGMRSSGRSRVRTTNGDSMKGRQRWISLFVIVVVVAVLLVVYLDGIRHPRLASLSSYYLNDDHPQIIRVSSKNTPTKTVRSCSHLTCFDVYRCASGGYEDRLSVYFHSETDFVLDGRRVELQSSSFFHDIKKTCRGSRFYSADIRNACVIVPPVDLLFPDASRSENLSVLLDVLPGWNGGLNHLIFTFHPGFHRTDGLNLGKAIVAAPGFTRRDFRTGFDISIPFHYPIATLVTAAKPERLNRKWLLAVITSGEPGFPADDLLKRFPLESGVLPLELCFDDARGFRLCSAKKGWIYPDILVDIQFCLASSSLQPFLWRDLLRLGCIPAVIDSDQILPFSEVLDWNRVAVFLQPECFSANVESLRQLDSNAISRMRRNGIHMCRAYFADAASIFYTTLEVLNSRLFPTSAKTYDQWNLPVLEKPRGFSSHLQLLPGVVPKNPGFTAVILTFDRIENLPVLLALLERCPSLQKIVIIWNNQNKAPPPDAWWPKLTVIREVIRTKSNRLNNRFFPYDEIPTDAGARGCQIYNSAGIFIQLSELVFSSVVFSLDDDILMLTPDEIEFGFQVWSENSERLVGFPSRLHVWNTTTASWGYEAEWSSRLSMVLTGAAFYSQLYNYYYTYKMPRSIIKYVDVHMNCEDIAMNFLIANMTRKGPIKVGPRKKFRCPECSNQDMLSADAGHLFQRSQCVSIFAAEFGSMPLVPVEFRADPVLHKEPVPRSEQRYPDMGAL